MYIMVRQLPACLFYDDGRRSVGLVAFICSSLYLFLLLLYTWDHIPLFFSFGPAAFNPAPLCPPEGKGTGYLVIFGIP